MSDLAKLQEEMRKRQLRARNHKSLKATAAVKMSTTASVRKQLDEKSPSLEFIDPVFIDPELIDPDPFDPECATWFPLEEVLSKRDIRNITTCQRHVGAGQIAIADVRQNMEAQLKLLRKLERDMQLATLPEQSALNLQINIVADDIRKLDTILIGLIHEGARTQPRIPVRHCRS